MITRDLAREVIGTAIARGGDSAELYVERTRSLMLRMDGSRLEEASSGMDQGVGLSLRDGPLTLYANGNGVDRECGWTWRLRCRGVEIIYPYIRIECSLASTICQAL